MVISSKIVKIRVPHRCWGCAIKFEKGDKMEVVTYVDDGRISSYYWCEICSEFWKKHLQDYCDGIYQGDLAGEEVYKEFKANYGKQ